MNRLLRILLVVPLAMALAHTLRGVWADALVQRELSALDARGLLERRAPAGSEPAELAAARQELDQLQLGLIGLELVENTPYAYFAPHIIEPEEVDRRVHDRLPFLRGLEALPEELWLVSGAPGDRADPGLMTVHATTNTLNLLAWQISRDRGDGRAAGEVSARALAVARAQDTGSSWALMLRWAGIMSVLGNAEQMIEAGVTDPGALIAPLEQELQALEDDRRLTLMLGSDLVRLQGAHSTLPFSLDGWLDRPGDLNAWLEFLDAYGRSRQQQSVAQFLRTGGFAPYDSMPPSSGSEQVWMVLPWNSLARQHEKILDQIAALRDSI